VLPEWSRPSGMCPFGRRRAVVDPLWIVVPIEEFRDVHREWA
jgi:hypothetical protein